MKGNSAAPGGLLASKPTWSNSFQGVQPRRLFLFPSPGTSAARGIEGKTDQAIGKVKQVAEKAVDKVEETVKKEPA